jgi:DNA-binding MarR family transcriptional regulator
MTRAYDEALRPSGVNASQLAILAAIDVDEPPSIAALSHRLAMDRTTLTRNLRPLLAGNWIRLGAEGWRRSKAVSLTAEGRNRLTQAKSFWNQAQAQFLKKFGPSAWKRAEVDLKDIAACMTPS